MGKRNENRCERLKCKSKSRSRSRSHSRCRSRSRSQSQCRLQSRSRSRSQSRCQSRSRSHSRSHSRSRSRSRSGLKCETKYLVKYETKCWKPKRRESNCRRKRCHSDRRHCRTLWDSNTKCGSNVSCILNSNRTFSTKEKYINNFYLKNVDYNHYD